MSSAFIRQRIEAARSLLAANPDQGRYSDKAATATLEEGLRCRTRGPDATLVTDMASAFGGGDAGPSPGWVLRAALASCDATLIAMRAAELGVALTRLEVTVDSESDDRGLLGVDDRIPAGPLAVRARVRISADGVGPERLRELVEWAEAHSPVADAVRRAVPTRTEIEPG
ncbi:MAG TPA: OsmC family protein [Anaeromyxobacteraceae bacterium]|nr:OsmC family protein [Anaeromyxobacteraceae bacterium]